LKPGLPDSDENRHQFFLVCNKFKVRAHEFILLLFRRTIDDDPGGGIAAAVFKSHAARRD